MRKFKSSHISISSAFVMEGEKFSGSVRQIFFSGGRMYCAWVEKIARLCGLQVILSFVVRICCSMSILLLSLPMRLQSFMIMVSSFAWNNAFVTSLLRESKVKGFAPLLKICMRSVANRMDAASGADIVRIRSRLYLSFRKKELSRPQREKTKSSIFLSVSKYFSQISFMLRGRF